MKIFMSLENIRTTLKRTTKNASQEEGGFLNFHKPLMTSGLLLMKNLLTSLAKNNLVPLGLITAAPAKDKAIQKKNFESGTATFSTSN